MFQNGEPFVAKEWSCLSLSRTLRRDKSGHEIKRDPPVASTVGNVIAFRPLPRARSTKRVIHAVKRKRFSFRGMGLVIRELRTTLLQEARVVEQKVAPTPQDRGQVWCAEPHAVVRQLEQTAEHGPLHPQLAEERHPSPQITQPRADPQPCCASKFVSGTERRTRQENRLAVLPDRICNTIQ